MTGRAAHMVTRLTLIKKSHLWGCLQLFSPVDRMAWFHWSLIHSYLKSWGLRTYTALTCRQNYCLFWQMENQVGSILLWQNICVWRKYQKTIEICLKHFRLLTNTCWKKKENKLNLFIYLKIRHIDEWYSNSKK